MVISPFESVQPKEVFNIITHCFEKLALEYKKRESDLSHVELKKQSKDYFDKIVSLFEFQLTINY